MSRKNPKGYSMNSPIYKRFWAESIEVHHENSEWKTEGNGDLVRKAPNLKKIRDFYKKRDKFYRLKNKRT
jgi:hypothetical protein